MADIETTTSELVGPNGELLSKPTEILTTEEAELLRKYKKFLSRHGYREALYCDKCWGGNREDGCKAFVTGQQIGILCRCRMTFFQGSTY